MAEIVLDAVSKEYADGTLAVSDLNLDITSAHITTFGEKAVDVFYVTDLTDKKITSPARQKAIRERLLEVLGSDWMADAR